MRSARRCVAAYSLPNTSNSRPSGSATRSFIGVEPPEPPRPNALRFRTRRPTCSWTARRIASPRRPPRSRWAARPRLPYVTGKTSSGQKSRNASTMMPIPRNAPNTASVGWSTARYIRARPSTTITTSVAQNHRCFHVPSGKSPNPIPSRVPASAATGADGIENPDQPPRIGTRSGRGRAIRIGRTVPTEPSSRIAPTNTTRWRHRRNQISARMVPHRRTRFTFTEPMTAAAFATRVSHGVRRCAMARRMASSHRSTATAVVVTTTPTT